MSDRITLPISVLDELIQLKSRFTTQLSTVDYSSEPSYVSLSATCKEYMVTLQRYMFRSIDQKGVELRRHYQRQTALKNAGEMALYAEMEEELQLLRMENDKVLQKIFDETTRAGQLLMSVGGSILRIQEQSEDPSEMQRMVAAEVAASEAEISIFETYKRELEQAQSRLKH
ncbi:hypothetical protein FQN52_000732 [Onygenales sp. PD_12]|nr:hypothetical protein FQN52_000732 [Onygenales sp. PD_12]KAK2804873.1 hypothetical protein FQN51_001515 [Onygenales sp. PD_10]